MKNLRNLLLLLLLSITYNVAYGQSVTIKNFIIKENLLKNNKVAIIAADDNDKPQEAVNGTFLFSINGFRQELKFNDGVAVAPQQIEKSTFIYLKHLNDSTTISKLYYVLKRGDELNPIKISLQILVIIPILIIIIASMFRKFIVFALVILIGIFLFNSNNGLNLPTFLETILDGLKSFF